MIDVKDSIDGNKEWYYMVQKNHAEKSKGRGSGDVRPILEQGNRQILQIVCRSKYLKEEILVENVKYKNKADIKTEEYFKNNF